MRYRYDHDFHIHSNISSCSNDPEQTKENILEYAKLNKLNKICITDHFWDNSVTGASTWYSPQNYDWISKSLPLPQTENTNFLFGCETEIDKFMNLGINKSNFDLFDFVIIPTTHLHMKGFAISQEDASTIEGRAKVWVSRLESLLDMDLPFNKIGIAHLTCGLIAPTREEYLKVLDSISSDDMEKLFTKAAKLGVGIELNKNGFSFAEAEKETVLRPFKIAKNSGCKFYLGTDAHSIQAFKTAPEVFERAITLLDLKESDKFYL